MKRDNRSGAGTLLITVLVILAGLFVMAMMQYFASSITKGKRILAHIAATDYACEAALDEAVLWFRGSVNNLEKAKKQADKAKQFHAALVKKGDASANVLFEPTDTKDLFKRIHKDMEIREVKITLDDKVEKVGEGYTAGTTPGKRGEKFYETKGVVNFSVVCAYETTRRTAVRAVEFRQVVILPPRDFSAYQFVATNFGYLARRVRKYVTEQKIMKDFVSAAAARIYFAYSVLTYIAEPQNPQLKVGTNIVVGLTFIRAVDAKARSMPNGGSLRAVQAQLEGDGVKPDGLKYWREKVYFNKNFNIDYVEAMAGATTKGLTDVLDQLKTEFNFKPSDNPKALSVGEPYPLSYPKDGGTPDTVGIVMGPEGGYQGAVAKKWGLENDGGQTSEVTDPMFQPADIKIKVAKGQDEDGSELPLKEFPGLGANDPAPRVAVSRVPKGTAWTMAELEFCVVPPPLIPKDIEPAPELQVKDVQPDRVAECKTSITMADIEEIAKQTKANHFVDLAKEPTSWGDKFGDLQSEADLKKEDFRIPGMSLYHPKSFPDWAFRLPVEWYQQSFSMHTKAFQEWKKAVKASADKYRQVMKDKNDKVVKIKIVDTRGSGGSTGTPATGTTGAVPATSDKFPTVPSATELGKRASYVFPTAKDFTDAMTAAAKATPDSADSLVLNGVYYIGKVEEENPTGTPAATTPAPAADAGKLELNSGQFIGQGEIVADHLVIKKGMKGVENRSGNLVLYSASPDKALELSSDAEIHASVITNSILKTSQAPKIKGMFVVKDVLCAQAAKETGDKAEETNAVDYYYRKLPKLTIEHPGFEKEAVLYSHMTFSAYRVASGGARGAK